MASLVADPALVDEARRQPEYLEEGIPPDRSGDGHGPESNNRGGGSHRRSCQDLVPLSSHEMRSGRGGV